MDPVSIISLVGACTGIALRAGTLIKDLVVLARRLQQADRSILQLTNRLHLFKETMEQLKTYMQRTNNASWRTKSTLRLFLTSCEDVLSNIEKHAGSVSSNLGSARNRLSFRGRNRVVWSEAQMAESEQKLGYQLLMMNSYIQLIELNNEVAQEDTIGSAAFTQTLRDATEGSITEEEWDNATIAGDFRETDFRARREPVTRPVPKPSLSASFKSLMSLSQRSAYASALCQACENRNPRKVQELLDEEKTYVNQSSSDGKLPLNCAVSAGQFTIIQQLLEHGADPNKQQKDGSSSLAIAIGKGNEAIAALLIKFGANVNAKSAGLYLLELAIKGKNEPMARLLIQNGADTCPSIIGSVESLRSPSLLMATIRSGDIKMVELLLENGADCQIHTPGTELGSREKKIYPLAIAIGDKNLQISETLFQFGADAEFWCTDQSLSSAGEAFYELVKDSSSMELAMLLLHHGARINLEMNILRTVFGEIGRNKLKKLLQAGLKVECSGAELLALGKDSPELVGDILDADPQRTLPLKAGDGNGTSLMEAIVEENIELVRLLLDRGAKPGGSQRDGWTPLCAAIFRHQVPGIIDLLLSRGADPNEACSNVSLRHPLFSWVDVEYISERETIEPSELEPFQNGRHAPYDGLQGYRADNVRPLHIAVTSKCCEEYVEKLIRQGADVNATYSYRQSEQEVKSQLGSWDGHAVGFTNISALHAATNEGGTVARLLDAGANVNARDGLGHTPRSWAITSSGNREKTLSLLRAGAPVINVGPKNLDAIVIWHEELNHRRGNSCQLGRSKTLATHATTLYILIGCGAKPGTLLPNGCPVLKSIQKAQQRHESIWSPILGWLGDIKQYGEFLTICRMMLERPENLDTLAGELRDKIKSWSPEVMWARDLTQFMKLLGFPS